MPRNNSFMYGFALLVVGVSNPAFAAEPSVVPGGHHDEVPVVRADGESVSSAVERYLVGRADVACADLHALGDLIPVRDALVKGTERSMPPWAPLRAAGCLTELADRDAVALQQVRALASNGEQPGFALVISDHLGVLPASVAVSVAQAAVDNPSPALERRLPSRLAASAHQDVRALVRASEGEPR